MPSSLDALNIHERDYEHERILRGYVITREDITKELDVLEHSLSLEASLLMGNDYTYTEHFVFGSNLNSNLNINHGGSVNKTIPFSMPITNVSRKEFKKLQKQWKQINFFRHK